MLYREFPAPPDLADYVRAFWALESAVPQHSVERLLPDGRQELIVHLGCSFEQLDSDGRASLQPPAILTGQTFRPLLLRPLGKVAAFGVCFHPGGAWPFLRWPQAEAAGRILPLDDVWHPTFARRIRECASDLDRCIVAAAMLRARLRPDPHSARLTAAIQSIQKQPWQRIDAAAELSCLSPRHFERLFLERVGLPPKTFAGILRFQNVLRLRETKPQWSWTRIAHESGYYDQAHLIADFRRFAGSPPAGHESEWTAMERAFVRA